ncbi:MAG: CRISPR-associated protein Cas5 [Spirosomataceae bacterium]
MKGYQIIIKGNWGHFKKPETNNNPLTHDLITKTALIGLIGAVLGIERKEMKDKFPELSEDILYGVQLLNPVKKASWGFTSRTAVSPTTSGNPKYFEFLKDPIFKVSIALVNKRSEQLFVDFENAIKNSESVYTPVLGWHNCPAELEWVSNGAFTFKENDVFETFGFVELGKHNPKGLNYDFRIGFERLPTFQDEEMWNLPDKYKKIIYPDSMKSVRFEGDYYEYQSQEVRESWWLI